MSLAAVVTIIGAVLTVIVLAAYLIYVALALRGVSERLRIINSALPLVAQKAAAAGPVVVEINKALAGVDAALQAVLAKDRQPRHAKPDPEMRPGWVVVPRNQVR